jgi:hypothetical protein
MEKLSSHTTGIGLRYIDKMMEKIVFALVFSNPF